MNKVIDDYGRRVLQEGEEGSVARMACLNPKKLNALGWIRLTFADKEFIRLHYSSECDCEACNQVRRKLDPVCL